VYFIYIAALGYWRSGSLLEPATFAVVIPLAIAAVALGEAIDRRRGWAIARDWLPVVFVLVAYWSVDGVALPHGDYEIENRIVRYDRQLLDNWGVRTAIESLGPLLPAILEAAYLGVYAVLPVTIAGFYARHERDRIDTFLLPFLVGTLAVYAVLPHYPSEAPRFVFDGIDIPPIHTLLRSLNVWILDHWDIQSSVLPSGHVAAGLSAALAMRMAVPEQPSLSWALFGLTLLVWVGAVYSRYHYAVDGLAAAAITVVAVGLLALGSRRRGPDSGL
jgi:membrane-associated phospholipid phosphatase